MFKRVYQANCIYSLANKYRCLAVCCLFGVAITSCTSLSIEKMPSHNYSQRIKFLVLHFTGLDYQQSVTALVDEGGLSAHYLLPEGGDPSYPQTDLSVLQLVDEAARAWHAGISFWQGRKDLNDQSIGIEIVHVADCTEKQDTSAAQEGQHPDQQLCLFEDYDPRQIELLITLAKDILRRNPDISPTGVVGHGDIAPTRKNDPGPRFPWYRLYKAGIGAWYDKDSVKHYWPIFNHHLPHVGLVQAGLRAYGYGVSETGVLDAQTIDTLAAFQMHFLPWQVTGKVDSKTTAVLFALLEKYFPTKNNKLMKRYEAEISAAPKSPMVVKTGQIEQSYPQDNPSTRALVNDREIFKSYKGAGQIIIDNIDAKTADLFVNGQKLNIKSQLLPYQRYVYSLSRRTQEGDNTFKIDNIQPKGSQLKITIPFPTLSEDVHSDDKRFSQVDALIEQDVQNGFPGAVLLVLKDGKIIKRSAYGYARKYADGSELLAQPVPMRVDHLFDLASNTKMFATNLALMKLVSDGKLDINQLVSHYLPEYIGQGRDTRLVRDLLTHTAGYAPHVRFFTPDNVLGETFYSHSKARTEQLLLRHVPFVVGRNGKAIYSDTDYMLLGLLVERLSHTSLDNYVENQLYAPLGLHNTRFNPLQKGFSPTQFAATEIQGNSRGGRVDFAHMRDYVLQGEVHDEKAFYSLGGVAGHAGLFSTVDDLAVLGQTLLNGGGYGRVSLFDQEVLNQFIKPEEGDSSYGLGWRRAAQGQNKWHFGPYASAQAYGHTGWTGTVSVIDPKHDLAIFLLTNARHSKVEDDQDGQPQFSGKQFETGKYGSVISLIYEAVLNAP